MRSVQLILTLALLVTAARADLFTTVDIAINPLHQVCSIATPGLTSCTVDGAVPENVNSPPPRGTVSVLGTAFAVARYGQLQVAANLQSSPENRNVDEYRTDLGAAFSDMLSVSGYSGAGFIQYGVAYGGIPLGNSTFVQGLLLNGEDVGFPQIYPFVADNPFPLTLGFEILSHSDVSGSCFCGAGSFEVAIDQILLFDSNLNPITGYTLTAASGTLYPAVGAAVPEPSALLLLVTAAIALACLRFKIHSSVT